MSKPDSDESYDEKREPKKLHNSITAKKKQRLIELVEINKLTIYKAAKRLNMCHPTAKFIMKNHRKTQQVKVEVDSHHRQEQSLGEPIERNSGIQNTRNIPVKSEDSIHEILACPPQNEQVYYPSFVSYAQFCPYFSNFNFVSYFEREQ